LIVLPAAIEPLGKLTLQITPRRLLLLLDASQPIINNLRCGLHRGRRYARGIAHRRFSKTGLA
jgi:hypothetical protein